MYCIAVFVEPGFKFNGSALRHALSAPVIKSKSCGGFSHANCEKYCTCFNFECGINRVT